MFSNKTVAESGDSEGKFKFKSSTAWSLTENLIFESRKKNKRDQNSLWFHKADQLFVGSIRSLVSFSSIPKSFKLRAF